MTYTLEGDDASLYEIDSKTGEIKVVEAYTPDYETKDAYNIVVKAVDANGNEVAQDITVPVEDIEQKTNRIGRRIGTQISQEELPGGFPRQGNPVQFNLPLWSHFLESPSFGPYYFWQGEDGLAIHLFWRIRPPGNPGGANSRVQRRLFPQIH